MTTLFPKPALKSYPPKYLHSSDVIIRGLEAKTKIVDICLAAVDSIMYSFLDSLEVEIY